MTFPGRRLQTVNSMIIADNKNILIKVASSAIIPGSQTTF